MKVVSLSKDLTATALTFSLQRSTWQPLFGVPTLPASLLSRCGAITKGNHSDWNPNTGITRRRHDSQGGDSWEEHAQCGDTKGTVTSRVGRQSGTHEVASRDSEQHSVKRMDGFFLEFSTGCFRTTGDRGYLKLGTVKPRIRAHNCRFRHQTETSD